MSIKAIQEINRLRVLAVLQAESFYFNPNAQEVQKGKDWAHDAAFQDEEEGGIMIEDYLAKFILLSDKEALEIFYEEYRK